MVSLKDCFMNNGALFFVHDYYPSAVSFHDRFLKVCPFSFVVNDLNDSSSIINHECNHEILLLLLLLNLLLYIALVTMSTIQS